MPIEEKITITCDNCGENIKYDDGGDMWNIHVSSFPRYHLSIGGRLAVIRYPPLREILVFCGMKCLKEYVNRD